MNDLFQYILCVGSRFIKHWVERGGKLVSIHPMCRFKNIIAEEATI